MPFIVQVARVRGATQTVPWLSNPGVHTRTHLNKLVSCLFLSCPSLHLWVARGSLPWTRPGCLSALSSYSSLSPFLPEGGCQDANPPGNSGSLPHCLLVHAVTRWQAELEVPKLWRAWRALVHGGGCPWGVHVQCTPSG